MQFPAFIQGSCKSLWPVENSLPDSRLSPSATCILPASAKAALQQTPQSISNFPFLHITVPLGFPFQTSSTVLPRKHILLCYQVETRNTQHLPPHNGGRTKTKRNNFISSLQQEEKVCTPKPFLFSLPFIIF